MMITVKIGLISRNDLPNTRQLDRDQPSIASIRRYMEVLRGARYNGNKIPGWNARIIYDKQ